MRRANHLFERVVERVWFRWKLRRLEGAFLAGQINEPALQQRATALVAFARTPGLSAWGFRRRVINSLSVGGLKPRTG